MASDNGLGCEHSSLLTWKVEFIDDLVGEMWQWINFAVLEVKGQVTYMVVMTTTGTTLIL